MPDSMVERVAQSSAEQLMRQETLARRDSEDGVWHMDGRALARAVLAAMREPTEAMLGKAYALEPDGRAPALSAAWQAMIDTALAEQ